ncbi:glycosyl transferase family 21-domain-containing protein [Gorgonomyces haynaldii]|nr:glycosyl transferase family 21-domain-containing protein [Gorgonomyces haynaldii]
MVHRPPFKSKHQPQVTIIRPLKGLDANLEENLESSFKQKYPNFEILIAIADAHDPSVPIANKLMEKYPLVKCQILIGNDNVGPNPKVNNLMKAYRKAQSDIIWVLDSNVYINPEALGTAVSIFENQKVGLVHHIPCGGLNTSFSGKLDALYMSATHARAYSALNALDLDSMVIGKSNMYRKSILDNAGGLENFAKFLSEDNEIGKAIWKQGYLHRIAPELCVQSMGKVTFSEYLSRRIRWIRIRKYVVPVATLLEPLTFLVVNAPVSAYFLAPYLNLSFYSFIAWQALFALASDFVMLSVTTQRGGNEFSSLQVLNLLLVWPVSELLAPFIWLLAILGSDIKWRGSTYRCNPDGTGTYLR